MATEVLAKWAVNLTYESLPSKTKKEAIRTFYNWLGCAIGGSQHEAVTIAIDTCSDLCGKKDTASILGRKEKFDISHASLINGISSHVFDFDDTHLATVIHPAGPVASSLLALSEDQSVTGCDFLTAFIAGIEAECRIGNAVFPDHYHRGWHITGSAGVFGSAIAIGKILKLDEIQMRNAIGIAASQPVGLREQFGTMTKSFHPGRAAQNGLLAAMLAKKGYTSSQRILEAPRGWLNVLSTKQDYKEITEELGTRWESETNTYKPFACGIVLHPLIDGCIQLRGQFDLKSIEKIHVTVHPLVLELTAKTRPKDGLEGKFSYTHVCAAALVHGKCGESEFDDMLVNSSIVLELREKVTAEVDESIASDSCIVEIVADGKTFKKVVEHARGSVLNPLTKEQLEDKFYDQVDPIIGNDKSKVVTEMCWNLEDVKSMGDITKEASL